MITDRRNIVWLASYPKSGNILARFIISSIIKGSPVKASRAVTQLVPDIHQLNFNMPEPLRQSNSLVYLKTNSLFSTDNSIFDRTHGYIYVLRHPVDVFVSSMRHLRIKDNDKINEAAQEFARSGAVLQFYHAKFGTWPGHLRSWLEKRNQYPNLVLTYRELISEKELSIVKISKYLNIPVDDDLISDIAAETSAYKMQKMEIVEVENNLDGVFYREYYARTHYRKDSKYNWFVGTGLTNRNMIDQACLDEIHNAFAPIIQDFQL